MKEDNRKINFNAGPAALPLPVLQQASEAILNYNGTGLSILSIPHRGRLFLEILEESKDLVTQLCDLDGDYEILWLHGGGRLQFCMLPMNFLNKGKAAAYIDSGFWAADAIEYAKYYGSTFVAASSKNDQYKQLPAWPGKLPVNTAYLHVTTNNTIAGTQWKDIPLTDVPLIADMSSDIFSCKRNYNQFDVFYAVAQKNIGPAGVTMVAIKKSMVEKAATNLPPMLSYVAHAQAGSLLNTPPVFAIYTSLLHLRWTRQKGLETIAKENQVKADLLYAEIERNTLFYSDIKTEDRSIMNVCFGVTNPAHENEFIHFCDTRNITGIEGHRKVGAFRVSLYNAISIADVQLLVNVMQEFEIKQQNHR